MSTIHPLPLSAGVIADEHPFVAENVGSA